MYRGNNICKSLEVRKIMLYLIEKINSSLRLKREKRKYDVRVCYFFLVCFRLRGLFLKLFKVNYNKRYICLVNYYFGFRLSYMFVYLELVVFMFLLGVRFRFV